MGDTHRDIGGAFGVNGYPTVKYYSAKRGTTKEQAVEYEGGPNPQELADWSTGSTRWLTPLNKKLCRSPPLPFSRLRRCSGGSGEIALCAIPTVYMNGTLIETGLRELRFLALAVLSSLRPT